MSTPLPIRTQSTDDILVTIREAILKRMPIRVRYDGGERLLCPHMLGRNKEGRGRILCLQLGGESASGLGRKDAHEEWRCLALEKLSYVELADVAWQPASSSLRRPKCLDSIELEVTDHPEREPQKGQ